MAARKTKATKSKSTRASKASVKKVTAPKQDVAMESKMETPIDTSSVKQMSGKRKAAIIVAIAVIGIILYLSRGLILAATVNGELVYRPTIISELEKRFGQQQLDATVTDMLINQEAKKKGISISDEELNSEVSKIEESVKAQGQDLNTLLTMQGMSRDELNKQIRTQKIVEKILADKINPTDQEVKEYMDKNKDILPKDKKTEEIQAEVKTQLQQQKLSTEFQTWLTEVKKNASIKYFVTY